MWTYRFRHSNVRVRTKINLTVVIKSSSQQFKMPHRLVRGIVPYKDFKRYEIPTTR